jgi:hypothetical protein
VTIQQSERLSIGMRWPTALEKSLLFLIRGPSTDLASNPCSQMIIALPIYEGAEEQDVVGPFEMLYWMSLFEALPPDRRPIGDPDFAVNFITESEFEDYFYPKSASKTKVFTVGPAIMTYRMSSGMQWTPETRGLRTRPRQIDGHRAAYVFLRPEPPSRLRLAGIRSR